MNRPSISDVVKPFKDAKLFTFTCGCGNKEKVSESSIRKKMYCEECIYMRARISASKRRKNNIPKVTMTKKERETKKFYRDLEKAKKAIYVSKVQVYGQGRTENVRADKLTIKDLKLKG
jgi:6-phosphogluconate dehydrogenase